MLTADHDKDHLRPSGELTGVWAAGRPQDFEMLGGGRRTAVLVISLEEPILLAVEARRADHGRVVPFLDVSRCGNRGGVGRICSWRRNIHESPRSMTNAPIPMRTTIEKATIIRTWPRGARLEGSGDARLVMMAFSLIAGVASLR